MGALVAAERAVVLVPAAGRRPVSDPPPPTRRGAAPARTPTWWPTAAVEGVADRDRESSPWCRSPSAAPSPPPTSAAPRLTTPGRRSHRDGLGDLDRAT